MNNKKPKLVAIVPAAGIGSRMRADRPKQYLCLLGKCVLQHTLERLAKHPAIEDIVVAVAEDDPWFASLSLPENATIHRVSGGKERAESVLNGLTRAVELNADWVLVHDAARPCLLQEDIERLIASVLGQPQPVGGILAHPVRDTMKRASQSDLIEQTLDRSSMWHALTPQMFCAQTLLVALQKGLQDKQTITDEASAMELNGFSPQLVMGSASNIKITHPEDLALAEFYLTRSQV